MMKIYIFMMGMRALELFEIRRLSNIYFVHTLFDIEYDISLRIDRA